MAEEALYAQRYVAAKHPDCPHVGYSENCPCTPGGSTILINGNEALTVAMAAEQVQVRANTGGSRYSQLECDDSGVTGVWDNDLGDGY